MKGKKAAQAANRRAASASATIDELRAELARERTAHKKVVHDLEAEIRQLRAQQLTEAARIAAKEVERRLAEVEEERRKRGMSDDMATHFMYQKDKFILNACRYVSMTTGVPARGAFCRVMTWCLDEDFAGVSDPVLFCMKIGIPLDGWVARQLKANKFIERLAVKRQREYGTISAISLDHAEELEHAGIHPDYDPSWYPKNVEYRGLEFIDDGDEA